METNNKHKQIIPQSIFAEATSQVLKCKPGEFTIQMIVENQEAYVYFQEKYYKVSTRDSLREDIEDQLSDIDMVDRINFSCWIDATRKMLHIYELIETLADNVLEMEEAQKLMIAKSLAYGTQDPYKVFWKVLYDIDIEGQHLGNAMVTTAEICGREKLTDKLLDLQIENGIQCYNRLWDGIFEEVRFDNANHKYPPFYIYCVDRNDLDI